MENNRRSDGKANQDVQNKSRQHQNLREVSNNGFEGMNFEQQRENYRTRNSDVSQNDPDERSTVRRRGKDI